MYYIFSLQVKKHFTEASEQECRLTRGSECSTPSASSSSVPSENSSKLPPHISLSLLGQHGGELLLYYNQSVNKDVIFGLIVQQTKVRHEVL